MTRTRTLVGSIAAAGAFLLLALPTAFAGELHPTFPLLDDAGRSVLESGTPVSAERSCGACHDTKFITEHDSHASSTGLNCFLCHLPNSNDDARRRVLASNRAEWSATATLAGTGIVQAFPRVGTSGATAATEATGDPGDVAEEFRYLTEAFDGNGHVRSEFLRVQDPRSDACGSCHGAVHRDLDRPFVWVGTDPISEPAWTSLRTGQVYSPQPMRESGLNLEEKARLSRSWDAHAERGLDCVDCHYSTNNPIYRRVATVRPDHLRFDARRIELGEYLRRPNHILAHGVEPGEAEGTMRDCATCHDASVGHDWLPYADRHFANLSCTACHVPELRTPVLRTVDATVTSPDGAPRVEFRGVVGAMSERWGYDLAETMASTYVVGCEPILLPRKEADGRTRIAPHNLVTTFRWVTGDPPSEISPDRITSVLYDDTGRPREDLLGAFDRDGDARWSDAELRLSTPEQVGRMKAALVASGVRNPRIDAVTVPFAITHGVATGKWALRDCSQCHEDGSRIDRSVLLAEAAPPLVQARLKGDERTDLAGRLTTSSDGRVHLTPSAHPGLYIVGKHANVAMNRIGLVSLLLVIVGIGVHASLRALRARTSGPVPHSAGVAAPSVYMYSSYERFWHWLQAAAIFLLLLTGLEVHFPGTFRLLGFDLAVRTHNFIAVVVVANAALAAFYHFASGQIRQFLPEPQGFFRGAILQIRYYLFGIFRGEPHPFEKNPSQKMNVLQQVTYLAILNLLLPLQVGTGLLIWGAQRWASVDSVFGGLGVLGPIHTLGAWLFAAFLVVHIYLTTTGPTPTAYVRAMVTGWEDEPAQSATETQS